MGNTSDVFPNHCQISNITVHVCIKLAEIKGIGRLIHEKLAFPGIGMALQLKFNHTKLQGKPGNVIQMYDWEEKEMNLEMG